jgi:hypothetical protein
VAADSQLASVGISQGRRAVDVRGGDHLEASILVLPPRMIVANRCRGQSMPAHTGAVLGRVVDESGSPIVGASIRAAWHEPGDSAAAGAKPDRVVKSDEDGRFAICGTPVGSVVTVRAESGNRSADVQWAQRELMTLSLVLRGG